MDINSSGGHHGSDIIILGWEQSNINYNRHMSNYLGIETCKTAGKCYLVKYAMVGIMPCSTDESFLYNTRQLQTSIVQDIQLTNQIFGYSFT